MTITKADLVETLSRQVHPTITKRDEEEVACPKCGAGKLTRCFSAFAVAGAEKKVSSSSKSCSSCSSHSCSTCG